MVGGPDPPPLLIIPGPALLTGDQTAAEISTALDQPVRWVTVPTEELGQMLGPHLGDEAAAGLTALYAAAADAPPPPPPDPSTIRPGTTSLRQWASRQDWNAPR